MFIWLFVFVLIVLLYVGCEIAWLVYVFVCHCVVLYCLVLFVCALCDRCLWCARVLFVCLYVFVV